MNPHMRASDADRERVVGALQQHTTEGRLTLDEFDQRSADAYAARTVGDLDAVTADLPPLREAATHPAPARATGIAGRSLWVMAAVVAVLASAGLIADAAAAGAMMEGMCH